jgi:hypothetical protein
MTAPTIITMARTYPSIWIMLPAPAVGAPEKTKEPDEDDCP